MDKDGTGTGTFQGSEDNRPSIVRGLQHGLGASVVHFLLRPSRLGAALLLIGVIAGLVWGDARQPPRNYPFEKVDAATWLRGRELHPAFRQTPVVPAGTDVRFVSRSVGAETKPCCGLTVTEDHIYEFIDKQTVPHVVAQLYRDGITGHVFALTTSGDVYAFSAENPATWSKLSHLEAASQPRPPLSASASDLVTFATLPSPVNSVAVSPDGQQVVAGTADGVLHCLPYSGGAENWTVSAHRSPILRVVWSHDGSRVATASSDGTAKVWDTHRDLQHVGQLFDALVAKSTITLRHSAAVNVVAFSSDDQYLLTASDDGTVRVWNFRADTLVRTIPAAANDAAFSPDGKRIAIALKGGGVEQWSLVDGRQIGAINEPVGPLTGVAYSPGGSELAAVSASGFTFLWDANTGMASVRAPGFPTSNRYLAYSPRGDRLVTASSAGELRLWFKPIPDVGPETSGTSFPITSMAFSADGSTMVLGGSDNTLRKWTVPRGGLPFASAIATDRSGALWVAGPGGYLARSPDGINWNQLAWGVQDDLIALKVIDFDRLAVLTARNHLLLISRLAARTGDSSVTASSTEPINGASLDIQDHDLSKYADKDRLLTFFTANEKSAWVAGTGGKILYTDDLNSENWTSLFSAPDLRISDLVVESTGVGWAVGTLGGRQTLIAANHATGGEHSGKPVV